MLKSMINFVMFMKTRYKQLILILADMAIVIFSYWYAAFLRYAGAIPNEAYHVLTYCTAVAIISSLCLSIIFGCYSGLWKYAGFETMFRQGAVAAIAVMIRPPIAAGISKSSSFPKYLRNVDPLNS